MRKRDVFDLPSREITEPHFYLRRREFLRSSALAAAAVALPPGIACGADTPRGEPISGVKPGPFRSDEEWTRFEDATSYNNFYEFGTDKGDPIRNAQGLTRGNRQDRRMVPIGACSCRNSLAVWKNRSPRRS